MSAAARSASDNVLFVTALEVVWRCIHCAYAPDPFQVYGTGFVHALCVHSHKYRERAHVEHGPLSVRDNWRGPLQVILKPDPGNPQELYLGSLEALGIDTRAHDVRAVQCGSLRPYSLTVSGQSVVLQSPTG